MNARTHVDDLINKETRETVWSPQPRQEEFLACPDYEVLFGGAAGGGKSDSMLIDALGLPNSAIEYPTYQAFIMRRSFADLKDLIVRARELYTQIAPSGSYNSQDHAFTFPSGARVEFIHMQHPEMRFNYRGRVCQYFGAEELTTFPSPIVYDYLMGRVRSVHTSLPCFVRATTNPDGPGELWVMDRWKIPSQGTATRQRLEIPDPETKKVYIRYRTFIPARLSDNKYLTATPEYKIALLSMPEDEREAMLYGRWGMAKLKGSYYAELLQKAELEGRIREVPHVHSMPVNTFWDLGNADCTSIWCHQKIADQHRFIFAYENSGLPLEHYVQVLEDRGYVWGTHFLPHDAAQERLKAKYSSEDSLADMLMSLRPNWNIEVQSRIEDIHVGIEATRQVFPQAWFDAENTEDGRAALKHYKKKFDEKNNVFTRTPVHNWASHYADAFRGWGQHFSGLARYSSGYGDGLDVNDNEDWRTV